MEAGARLRLALRLSLFAVACSAATASAQVAGGTPVPVAARDLPRGAVLTSEDIAYVAAPAPSDARAAVGQVGWSTRRVLTAGEPLVAPAVAPPDLVRAGQKVEAVWRQGAIELRLAGRATGSAALGERVMVRIDVRRRVGGVVVGPGLVRVESLDRSR